MDDILANFLAAQQAFGERVHAVTESQWQAGTPDEQWSVADLVTHLVDEHRVAAPIVHGHDLASAQTIADGARRLPVDGGVGANLAESWDEAAAASADALSEDGALARQVTLSRGTTPAADYAVELIVDLVVHAWDLQIAIDFPAPLPAGLVDTAWAQAQQWGDLSGSGVFGAPVDVSDDASSLDKLLAKTGRTPR